MIDTILSFSAGVAASIFVATIGRVAWGLSHEWAHLGARVAPPWRHERIATPFGYLEPVKGRVTPGKAFEAAFAPRSWRRRLADQAARLVANLAA